MSKVATGVRHPARRRRSVRRARSSPTSARSCSSSARSPCARSSPPLADGDVSSDRRHGLLWSCSVSARRTAGASPQVGDRRTDAFIRPEWRAARRPLGDDVSADARRRFLTGTDDAEPVWASGRQRSSLRRMPHCQGSPRSDPAAVGRRHARCPTTTTVPACRRLTAAEAPGGTLGWVTSAGRAAARTGTRAAAASRLLFRTWLPQLLQALTPVMLPSPLP